jgi:hypothetical protein
MGWDASPEKPEVKSKITLQKENGAPNFWSRNISIDEFSTLDPLQIKMSLSRNY